MTDLRGTLVEEVAIERVTNMVISEVSLGTAGIDVLSNDNFGLMLESNVNMRNEFTTTAMKNLETQNIMCVGTSSSKRSSVINMKWFRRYEEYTPHLQRPWLNVQLNGESGYHALTHH